MQKSSKLSEKDQAYFERIKAFTDKRKLSKLLLDNNNNFKTLNSEQLERIDEYIEIREECDFELSNEQETEILLGFICTEKIDVSLYWNPKYSERLMKTIRICLEKGVNVTKILGGTKFTERDLLTLSRYLK